MASCCSSVLATSESLPATPRRSLDSKKNSLKRHQLIEEELKEDQRRNRSVFRLLLLGAAESGKSTIVKQMRLIHSTGFTKDELDLERVVITENMILSMLAMLDAVRDLAMIIELDRNQFEKDGDLVRNMRYTLQNRNSLMTNQWAALKRLWNHPTIRKVFARSHEYQLTDSTEYFYDELERIASSDYQPTEQDVLRSRVSTLGIVELVFSVRSMELRIIDVGGQRTQRRKWIHCFDNVQALVFVAAMSDYNQMLAEDFMVNRMHESLNLFGSIINCRWFVKSHVILFLNKRDIFEEKLKRKFSITAAFPGYTGSNSFEETSTYIENQFMHRKKDQKKQVYCHFTCATDTSTMQFVIDSCLDMVFSEMIRENGLY